MKSDIRFKDGDEAHRLHPDTFTVPSENQKRAVQESDHVKIGLEGFSRACQAGGERLYVQVSRAAWPLYAGTVLDKPMFGEEHGVRQGDTLDFEARHILHIVTVGQQRLEEELGGSEFVLDENTTFLVKPDEDKAALLVFHRILTTRSPSPSENAYQQAFVAAAENLGLRPEMNDIDEDGIKETCFLTIHMRTDAPVYEMLETVRERVEAIETEAKRMLVTPASEVPESDRTSAERLAKHFGLPVVAVSEAEIEHHLRNVPILICTVDEGVGIVVRRLPTRLRIIVTLDMATEDEASADDKFRAMAFDAAARKLGFQPGPRNDHATGADSIITWTLPSSVDGRTILQSVRERIEAIRRDAKQGIDEEAGLLRPFVEIVGLPASGSNAVQISADVFRRIDPRTIPFGLRVTVSDGEWHPLTLTRDGEAVEVQFDLNGPVRGINREEFPEFREKFIGFLTKVMKSLEHEEKVSGAMVAPEGDLQVAVRWKTPLPPGMSSADLWEKVRLHCDLIYSRVDVLSEWK